MSNYSRGSKAQSTSKAQPPLSITPSHCNSCSKPDSFDHLVQCDECDKWYHFSCAKVTEQVEQEPWSCDQCRLTTNRSPREPNATSLLTTTTVVHSPRSVSSQPRPQPSQPIDNTLEVPKDIPKPATAATKAVSRRSKASSLKQANLRLQRLEEEAKLRAQRDHDYINKKYEILEQLNSSNEEDSDSAESFDEARVEKWVKESIPVCKKVDVRDNQAIGLANVVKSSLVRKRVGDGPAEDREQRTRVTGNAVLPTLQVSKGRTDFADTQPRTNVGVGLNKQQLAARQVMSKDYINFTGRSEEWPLFISWWENSTQMCGYSNHENLLRLQRCLKGKALEAVRFRLLHPEQVEQIISTLRMLYGRPESIVQSILQKIRSEPPPKAEKLETVIAFALSVENACSTMQVTGLSSHLNNPCLLQELVERLPSQLKLSWGLFKQDTQHTNLSTFSDWLSQVAKAASEVTTTVSDCQESRTTRRPRAVVNVHELDGRKTESRRCCICNGSCNSIIVCETFINMDLQNKWSAVRRHTLCRMCLRQHGKRRCSSSQVCGIEGCTYRHHRLLHNTHSPTIAKVEASNSTSNRSQYSCTTYNVEKISMLFKILPVTLHYGDNKVDTYAFLDDGSSVTLVDEELAQALGADGEVEPLCLKWTANAQRNEDGSKRINLEVSTSGSQKRFPLPNVHTVKALELPKQSINARTLTKRFEHLKNIPLASYEQAKPRVLIGLRHWTLGIPLRTVEGKDNQPVAIKTRLGWTVFGSMESRPTSKGLETNYHFHMCECQRTIDEETHRMVKEYFAIDTAGIKGFKKLRSADDERAVQMLESKTQFDGKQYAVPLLWRYDNVSLPCSRQMAERRLSCLQKKLSREPKLAAKLDQLIQEYVDKGYARRLRGSEIKSSNGSPVWYLPIFPISNHNKPNKVRLVWDAAAKAGGVSLNSLLLTGPDEVPALAAILFRFRERKFALAADIREMFHQVKIIEAHQDAQRFLWRNSITKEVEVFKMLVMTFGSTCSPYCAQFVKNKNAERFAEEFPRAYRAIVQNHYVDDFLDSVDSEEEAVQLAKEVIFIHDQGGFEIRNFLSNSGKVMNALKDRSSSIDRGLTDLSFADSAEKLLGMWWSPVADTFLFTFKNHKIRQDVILGRTVPTKREVLRALMCTFDPLGLIANFIIILKILLQDIWRTSIEWDEKIKDSHFERWRSWLSLIPTIKNITIQRPYLSNLGFGRENDVQLHVFVDASESAYAAAAYLRVSSDSAVECALVSAKTKVGPIRAISIPRMELEAAVLGTRLAKSIINSHSIKIKTTTFWTDSRIVLCWIRSDHRKYKQFVAFRVGEILESTEQKDWRWVPTKDNVADDATKYKGEAEFVSNRRWYKGPSFIHLPEAEWPIDVSGLCQQSAVDQEVKACYIHTQGESRPVIEYTRFSKWSRLLRSTMYILRFIDLKCKKSTKSGADLFTPAERYRAENCLYRECQKESFRDEFELLRGKGETETVLHRSSVLYKLSPYMDEHEVIRLKGRIDAAQDAPQQMKRPVILHKRHHITNLIVTDFHVRFHHLYTETVVNEIRQAYYIPCLRAVLKKVQNNCQYCKNRKAVPQPPRMAQLPAARLKAFTRAFSYIGMDYFGPLYVKVGRHKEKRWGMLITCLTVRAIHIEIAHSLSSDSCILGLKRFVARRGMPLEIYSDNGTNFRGASEELKDAMGKLDNRAIERAFESVLKWSFIPPMSPHMGGSWERLVRSVKQTLTEITPTTNPTDELLLSMMAEVETIVNSRPLTYVPIDDGSDEALTPNHFLMGSSSGLKVKGEMFSDGMTLKKNWLNSEMYANSFWRRWVREYLPDLTRRTKWFGPCKPLMEGDIVIITDPNSPRGTWLRGKVIKVQRSGDGLVRSAVVQTSSGIYTRPALKLAVLDVHKFGDDGNQGIMPSLPGGNVAELGSTT